jgi:hypothetical protein
MPVFILMSGFPGSGKTHTVNELKRTCEYDVYERDGIYNDLIASGKTMNRARKELHSYPTKTFSELTDRNVIYDSINPNAETRTYFLNLVPSWYTKRIIFFEPSELIKDGMYDQYVTALHQIRTSHNLFPTDNIRAVETIKNIASIFEGVTQQETEMFNVVIKKSFEYEGMGYS